MSEQQYCRSCEKPRGITAKKPGLCPRCAGSLSGKKFVKSNPMPQYETVKEKQARMTTTSFWLEAGADYTAAAKRMAGNGWEV